MPSPALDSHVAGYQIRGLRTPTLHIRHTGHGSAIYLRVDSDGADIMTPGGGHQHHPPLSPAQHLPLDAIGPKTNAIIP